MEVLKTLIEGVVIIEPRLLKMVVAVFFESFNQKEFEEEKFCKTTFVTKIMNPNRLMVLFVDCIFKKLLLPKSKLVRVVKGTVLMLLLT